MGIKSMSGSPRHVFDYRDRHVYPFSPRQVRRLKVALTRFVHHRNAENSSLLRSIISQLFHLRPYARQLEWIERALLNRRGPLGGSSIVWSPDFEWRLSDLMEYYRLNLNDLSDDEDDFEE